VIDVVAKDADPFPVDKRICPLQRGVGACVVNDNYLPATPALLEVRGGGREYPGDLVLLIEDGDDYRKGRWNRCSVGELQLPR
jgi:hypothetical protein